MSLAVINLSSVFFVYAPIYICARPFQLKEMLSVMIIFFENRQTQNEVRKYGEKNCKI